MHVACYELNALAETGPYFFVSCSLCGGDEVGRGSGVEEDSTLGVYPVVGVHLESCCRWCRFKMAGWVVLVQLLVTVPHGRVESDRDVAACDVVRRIHDMRLICTVRWCAPFAKCCHKSVVDAFFSFGHRFARESFAVIYTRCVLPC